ncbi:MAG: class I SAM-dependent methyltransferase [Hyphomicrobiaceae bacterium]
MHEPELVEGRRLPRRTGLREARDRVVLKLLCAALSRLARGRVTITLPSGACGVFGPGGGAEAELVVRRSGLLAKSLLRGPIGFAESYMSGDFDTPDLESVFRFFVDNKAALAEAGRGHFRVRLPDRLAHRFRRNTRRGSRRNIRAHYDLGNDFFAPWLDETMTYSSAIFTAPGVSLEAAQEEKYARLLAALEIAPGHDVLEIGCGWGSLAERLARRGARVTAITISREQAAHARRRLARSGLASSAEVRLQDYRDTRGRFDRVVSVEMIEAVGEENWPRYFDVLAERLAPGGVAVVQAITISEELFQSYRRKTDFIQRFIFPGGMLPTERTMQERAAAAGLHFERVELFGASYALTLDAWRRRFAAAWPRLAALGFDERFRRMWDYYLAYCKVGFEKGTIDVGFYRLRKPAEGGPVVAAVPGREV